LEEGYSSAQSNIKEHHGLRFRDVIGNHQLFVEGKNTNGGRGRAKELKPGNVLVCDRSLYRELTNLAAASTNADANLLGLGPSTTTFSDGYWRLQKQVRILRRFLPDSLKDFEIRWLRHSWAINALRNKVDIVSIQRQLRHSKLEVTAIYLRFCPPDGESTINAFEGLNVTVERRDCPGCGFAWDVDKRTGAMLVQGKVDAALMRRQRPTLLSVQR
jgi:hypothetical protein